MRHAAGSRFTASHTGQNARFSYVCYAITVENRQE